jgi:hypothetical protein
VSAVWFLLLDGLLAADAKLSLGLTTVLAALLGLYHGYLNGAGRGLSFTSAAALLGLIFAVFVLIALATAFVVQLQASRARIAVRMAGSRIFASSLLLLGWAVRNAHMRAPYFGGPHADGTNYPEIRSVKEKTEPRPNWLTTPMDPP